MKRQAEIDTERIRRHLSLEKKDGCREEEEVQENSGQMGQKTPWIILATVKMLRKMLAL